MIEVSEIRKEVNAKINEIYKTSKTFKEISYRMDGLLLYCEINYIKTGNEEYKEMVKSLSSLFIGYNLFRYPSFYISKKDKKIGDLYYDSSLNRERMKELDCIIIKEISLSKDSENQENLQIIQDYLI